jgi:hypothetical protein
MKLNKKSLCNRLTVEYCASLNKKSVLANTDKHVWHCNNRQIVEYGASLNKSMRGHPVVVP